MVYSELVTATLEDDQPRLNAILDELFPVLTHYLVGTMNASRADAEDCAQQALLNILEKIKQHKIRDAESVFSYLLKTCRNNYLRMTREKNRLIPVEEFTYLTEPDEPLQQLIYSEEINILEECLSTLSAIHRSFISYFFEYPDIKSSQVAEVFDLTIAGVWSKKHRIIQKLIKCVKIKMK